MTAPSWSVALPICPPGAALVELWMTTFEAPDGGLLVDHLLPALLGIGRAPSPQKAERTLYFGELADTLAGLRGRLTVISSPSREQPADAPYPWLWRYVDHHTVGARGPAVQHAKLWAFHWRIDGAEWIELYVSSINLTTDAFKRQMQAAWRAMLPLAARETQTMRRSWGELVPFLENLGEAAGPTAAERMRRLVQLLGRAPCPDRVSFIASTPSGKSAARQLRYVEPSRIYVLTPTIGEWREATLNAFAKDADLAPSAIQLAWLSTRHPWAQRTGWCMTEPTYHELVRSGVGVVCIPSQARLADQHLEQDERWSHAKLYLLRSRRKRYLLVTSANWSIAAWGAGKTPPRNFELGVLFESEWASLETLGEPFAPPELAPYCTDRVDDEPAPSSLEWAEATWDGREIVLSVRSSRQDIPVSATVHFLGAEPAETGLTDGAARIPWSDALQPPSRASFRQGHARLEVAVLDLRAPDAFEQTPLPEVDPAVMQAVKDAFLLQRYGGPAVEPEFIPGLSATKPNPQGPAQPADYTVEAWTDARQAFAVVDRWRQELREAAANPTRRGILICDGAKLQDSFRRQGTQGAELAAQELAWRMEDEP